MILTVDELKNFIDIDENDEVLEFKIQGLTSLVHKTTNNNFIKYKNEYGVIVYPYDLKLGLINIFKWEMENRDKIGISSETISRHSVSYNNLSNEDTECGYPKFLMSFLDPYRKARF